jgi:hypothetical protein
MAKGTDMEKEQSAIPQESGSSPNDVRLSKARTLDHEVKRLPDSALERRRQKRMLTVNEELQRQQVEADKLVSRWTVISGVIALAALGVAAWPYVRDQLLSGH